MCETAGEHWSFGLEAFGVRFDDEHEAAISDRGERVAVGFDLEWETPDRVYGEILLGRRQIEFDGTGSFLVRLTVRRVQSGRSGADGRHRARHEVRVDRIVDAHGAPVRGVLGAVEREEL